MCVPPDLPIDPSCSDEDDQIRVDFKPIEKDPARRPGTAGEYVAGLHTAAES